MIELLKHCALVITDSGGLQKEAFFFKKGCVTLRAETEWTELVEGGFNILAGANPSQILTSYNQIMNKYQNFSVNLYGIGDASSRIADVLKTI
jgi:UDP-GlcNAc3NAcA epimerase